MKEKILAVASELFLNRGFRSVTMEDLASEMGISKKTIYIYFKNKTELVAAASAFVFDQVCSGIDAIVAQQQEPIAELYAIKSFVMFHLKDEKTAPQYQLQKYYPDIYAELSQKEFKKLISCVQNNLERGILKGVFRKDINREIVSKLYFLSVVGLKDQKLFPLQYFPMRLLMDTYLEYHIRGIATEVGIQVLNNLLRTKNES